MPRLTEKELRERLFNFLGLLDRNHLYTLRTDNVKFGFTVMEIVPDPDFKGIRKEDLITAFREDGFELGAENKWVEGVNALQFIKDLDERRIESVHVLFVCTDRCIPLLARYNFWKSDGK